MRFRQKADGTRVPFTPEEEALWDEREQGALANAEGDRIESLYQAAMAQQVATCDSNFYGLLTAIGALSQGTGQPMPPKASECIQWLETMWADYHGRKASGSTDFDFSMHGRCPHSFLDVRGE